MADLATIGLRIENGQAVQALNEMNAAFERTTQKIAASGVKFEAWQRQLADKAAAQVATENTNRLNAEIERTNTQATSATGGIGRFRGSLTSLASQVIGLNPQVSNLASLLGTFAIGSGPLVLILAGVAAIGFAYNKLTEDTRKAREETDHFLKSLRDQARAAKDASVAGAEARAAEAREIEADLRRKQRAFNESGGGPGVLANRITGQVERAHADVLLAEANATKVKAAANRDLVEAVKGLNGAVYGNIANLEKLAAAHEKAFDKGGVDEYGRSLERLSRIAAQHAAEEEAQTNRIINGVVALIRERAKLKAIDDELYGHLKLSPASPEEMRADIQAAIGQNAQGVFAPIEDAERLARQRTKEMLNEIQRDFATFFANIFTKGIQSFGDLFRSVRDMFNRLLAEMAAANIAKKFGGLSGLFGNLGTNEIGGQGWLKNSSGGPPIPIPAGSTLKGETVPNAAYGGSALAGFGTGYGLGGAAGNAAGGAAVGAGSGALIGAAIAGPVGAVIGGLTGLAGGLIAGGNAARAHAKALQEAKESLTVSIKQLAAQVHGDTLGAQLAQNEQNKLQLIKSAKDTFPTAGAWFDVLGTKNLADGLAAITALFKENADKIKADFERARQYANEDLRVRLLRAEGHGSQADALALQNQQQRERDDLIRSFGAEIDAQEAATLALLDQVQSAERLRKSIDELNTSVRNAPSGFKIESYINRFATPRPLPFGFSPDQPVNTRHPTSSALSRSSVINMDHATITLQLPPGMKPEDVGPAFMKFLRKTAAATVGMNAPLASALDYA